MSRRKVQKLDIDSLEELTDLEFELEQNRIKKGGDSKNYVNNKELYELFVEYHAYKMSELEKGNKVPPLPEKIALACMQISTRRCYSRRFFMYSADWLEEMIEDAIVATIENGHKFDPARSENPFAYLTSIVNNAVFNRLNIEAKNDYIKLKSYDNNRGFYAEVGEGSDEESIDIANETNLIYNDRLNKIGEYEVRFGLNKQRKKHERSSANTNTLDITDFKEKD